MTTDEGAPDTADAKIPHLSGTKLENVVTLQAVIRRCMVAGCVSEHLERCVKERWNALSQASFVESQSQMLDASFLRDYREELLNKVHDMCKRTWTYEALFNARQLDEVQLHELSRERKTAANLICACAKRLTSRSFVNRLADEEVGKLVHVLSGPGPRIETCGKQWDAKEPQFAADLSSLASHAFVAELRSANITSILSRDGDGNTALHFAAWRGQLLACHWLISQGADIQAKNKAGRTPLIFAQHSKNSDCEQFLRASCSFLAGKLEKTPSELSHDETNTDFVSVRSGDWDEQSTVNSAASFAARSNPASPPEQAQILWRVSDSVTGKSALTNERSGLAVVGAALAPASFPLTRNPSPSATQHAGGGTGNIKLLPSGLDAILTEFEGAILNGAVCDVKEVAKFDLGQQIEPLVHDFEFSILSEEESDRFQTGTCYHRFLFSDELGLQTPQTSFTESPERVQPMTDWSGTEPPPPSWNVFNVGLEVRGEEHAPNSCFVHAESLHRAGLGNGPVDSIQSHIQALRERELCVFGSDGRLVSQTLLA